MNIEELRDESKLLAGPPVAATVEARAWFADVSANDGRGRSPG